MMLQKQWTYGLMLVTCAGGLLILSLMGMQREMNKWNAIKTSLSTLTHFLEDNETDPPRQNAHENSDIWFSILCSLLPSYPSSSTVVAQTFPPFQDPRDYAIPHTEKFYYSHFSKLARTDQDRFRQNMTSILEGSDHPIAEKVAALQVAYDTFGEQALPFFAVGLSLQDSSSTASLDPFRHFIVRFLCGQLTHHPNVSLFLENELFTPTRYSSIPATAQYYGAREIFRKAEKTRLDELTPTLYTPQHIQVLHGAISGLHLRQDTEASIILKHLSLTHNDANIRSRAENDPLTDTEEE